MTGRCAALIFGFLILFWRLLPALPASQADYIAKTAGAMQPQLIETRRDLHMHPELSGQERRTSEIVAGRLRELGFDEIRTNVAGFGVVGLLRGSQEKPVVAVRADMDALPIKETLDVPYKSQVPGVKHACGHDAHTTIALGSAELLAGMRAELRGSVKFIFQPSEENFLTNGLAAADEMIKEGVLEKPHVEAIFGLHTTPETETGKIGYRAGPAQAAFDLFTIHLHGKSAYAATPEKGVDTMLVAADVIQSLQTIKSRRLSAFDPVSITIGKINGGKSPHTIAEEIILEGTTRTFDPQVRAKVEALIRQTVAGVDAVYGASSDIQYKPGTMIVYNDPALVERSLPALRQAVGDTNVFEFPLRMGAEDFSFYQQVVPGLFLRLGSGNSRKGIVAESHTPGFDIDEDCLVVGVKAISSLVLNYFETWHSEH